ncbi:hypothetical protein [Devosia sp.]|uniref:hypothetical protein n=1 Tax=Devosia sp. TaxID=1871048 RepID=UPI003A956D95
MTHLPLVRHASLAVLTAVLGLASAAPSQGQVNLQLVSPDGAGPRITDRVSAPKRSQSSKRSRDNDDGPGIQTRYFGTRYDLTCTPAGSAGDLVITNDGLDTVPSGTRIRWQVADTGQRGYFALIGDLKPMESLLADDILSEPVDGSESCSARSL